MSKAVNASMIETLAKDLEGSDSCVLIGWEGMTVHETVALRSKLRAQNFRMRVVKNNLASITFDQVEMKGLGSRLAGPSAVVFGGEGAIAISKILVAETATNKKLKIRGGYSEGEVLDPAGIDALSKVPGRQELLSMTLAAMFGPASDMARSLDGLFSEVHGLIEAIEKKNEVPAEAAS
jgi:large subunit ribosomal protein L10